MGIGKTLSELIKFKKTNVNELARNAEVSPQTIYAIIKRDSKKADIGVLLKISKVLGVNVDYFFNNDINIATNNIVYIENDLQEEIVPNDTNITYNICNNPTKRKSLDELIKEEDRKHYVTIAGYGGGVKTIDLDEKE